MAGLPVINRAEIDKLATAWCKSKGVIVIIDEVSRQFACDVANLVLKNFVAQCAEKIQAAKEFGANPSQVTSAKNLPQPAQSKPKPTLILTD